MASFSSRGGLSGVIKDFLDARKEEKRTEKASSIIKEMEKQTPDQRLTSAIFHEQLAQGGSGTFNMDDFPAATAGDAEKKILELFGEDPVPENVQKQITKSREAEAISQLGPKMKELGVDLSDKELKGLGVGGIQNVLLPLMKAQTDQQTAEAKERVAKAAQLEALTESLKPPVEAEPFRELKNARGIVDQRTGGVNPIPGNILQDAPSVNEPFTEFGDGAGILNKATGGVNPAPENIRPIAKPGTRQLTENDKGDMLLVDKTTGVSTHVMDTDGKVVKTKDQLVDVIVNPGDNELDTVMPAREVIDRQAAGDHIVIRSQGTAREQSAAKKRDAFSTRLTSVNQLARRTDEAISRIQIGGAQQIGPLSAAIRGISSLREQAVGALNIANSSDLLTDSNFWNQFQGFGPIASDAMRIKGSLLDMVVLHQRALDPNSQRLSREDARRSLAAMGFKTGDPNQMVAALQQIVSGVFGDVEEQARVGKFDTELLDRSRFPFTFPGAGAAVDEDVVGPFKVIERNADGVATKVVPQGGAIMADPLLVDINGVQTEFPAGTTAEEVDEYLRALGGEDKPTLNLGGPNLAGQLSQVQMFNQQKELGHQETEAALGSPVSRTEEFGTFGDRFLQSRDTTADEKRENLEGRYPDVKFTIGPKGRIFAKPPGAEEFIRLENRDVTGLGDVGDVLGATVNFETALFIIGSMSAPVAGPMAPFVQKIGAAALRGLGAGSGAGFGALADEFVDMAVGRQHEEMDQVFDRALDTAVFMGAADAGLGVAGVLASKLFGGRLPPYVDKEFKEAVRAGEELGNELGFAIRVTGGDIPSGSVGTVVRQAKITSPRIAARDETRYADAYKALAVVLERNGGDPSRLNSETISKILRETEGDLFAEVERNLGIEMVKGRTRKAATTIRQGFETYNKLKRREVSNQADRVIRFEMDLAEDSIGAGYLLHEPITLGNQMLAGTPMRLARQADEPIASLAARQAEQGIARPGPRLERAIRELVELEPNVMIIGDAATLAGREQAVTGFKQLQALRGEFHTLAQVHPMGTKTADNVMAQRLYGELTKTMNNPTAFGGQVHPGLAREIGKLNKMHRTREKFVEQAWAREVVSMNKGNMTRIGEEFIDLGNPDFIRSVKGLFQSIGKPENFNAVRAAHLRKMIDNPDKIHTWLKSAPNVADRRLMLTETQEKILTQYADEHAKATLPSIARVIDRQTSVGRKARLLLRAADETELRTFIRRAGGIDSPQLQDTRAAILSSIIEQATEKTQLGKLVLNPRRYGRAVREILENPKASLIFRERDLAILAKINKPLSIMGTGMSAGESIVGATIGSQSLKPTPGMISANMQKMRNFAVARFALSNPGRFLQLDVDLTPMNKTRLMTEILVQGNRRLEGQASLRDQSFQLPPEDLAELLESREARE